MKQSVILLSLVITMIPSYLRAVDPQQKIDVGKLPATVVEDVVVPVPSEVFNVLDKLTTPNWLEILRPVNLDSLGERPQVALLLGTVIAEGFIAVEAQNSEEVKKIGRNVLNLAGAIGVRKSVVARSSSITEAADKKDWNKVRVELDGALHDVRGAMIELKDEQLAQLVSLGGWLRGTEALTTIIQKNYSKDGAELLHQPVLLNYFNNRLETMDPRLKKHPLVGKIKQRLPEIKPLIDGGQGSEITAQSVEQIHRIVTDLVKSVTTKEP